MKYFTKYLPQEGMIKPGDQFKRFDGIIEEMKDVDYGDFNPNDLGSPKVKLFLCSRDIQVGDKIRFSEAEEYGENECKSIKYLNGDEYKVIGEISPDALSYVKEGQEFDDDEIKQEVVSFNIPLPDTINADDIKAKFLRVGSEVDWITEKIEEGVKKITVGFKEYKVKGPCGRFH